MADKEGSRKVALIAGATGIIGRAMVELLMNPGCSAYSWKVYAVARRPQPSWLNQISPAGRKSGSLGSVSDSVFQYVQCDLLDREDTLAKLSPLKDVTHLFWMTWVKAGVTEEENVEANSRMYKNALDAIVREDRPLEHIAVTTGGKYYLGSFSETGKITVPDLPFREDAPRRPGTNFYHNLMDKTLDAVKSSNGKLTWSEHRPTGVWGFAPRNQMNVVGTIATYALICKEENLPFVFPGSRVCWEGLSDCSDAGLIAEQQLWAATSPAGKNQSFNITNGDVVTWKGIWHAVAERFGLDVPEYREGGPSMVELMKGKGSTWDAIVEKHGLEKTKVDEVGHWWFLDLFANVPFEIVLSMNKSRKLGFLGWRESLDSLRATLDEMKRYNVIP